MIHRSNRTRSRILVAAALLGAIAVGCGLSVRLAGKGKLPMGSGVELEVEVGPGGEPVANIDGGSTIANKCVAVTFSGADGAETGSSTISVGPNGSFSVPIPEGSVRIQGVISDCPEEEEGDPPTPPSSIVASSLGGASKPGIGLTENRIPLSKVNTVIVFGMPLGSDLTIGVEHLYYSFRVLADSHSEAEAMVQPLFDRGMGAVVPAGVTVYKYSTLTPDVSGGCRVVAGVPGKLLSWNLDFNNGAFYADLFNRSIRYTNNGWDVVELVIPASEFDSGVLPGVTYINGATEKYRVDYLPGVQTASWLIEATINP